MKAHFHLYFAYIFLLSWVEMGGDYLEKPIYTFVEKSPPEALLCFDQVVY